MTKDKKINWGALRCCLTALIWLPPLTAFIICRSVPREVGVFYENGQFFTRTNLEERFDLIFQAYLCAALLLGFAGIIAELAKRGCVFKKKLAGIIITALLVCAAVISDFFLGALPLTDFSPMPDLNAPYNLREISSGGNTYVLCDQPHGMHDFYTALYDVTDGRAVFLGSADEQGSTRFMDDIEVSPEGDGFMVNYIVTKNGAAEEKQFFIDLRGDQND